MPLVSEERKKRLQSLDEIMGQSLDEQIKEHKASAKVSCSLHFDSRNLLLLRSVPKIDSTGSICPPYLSGDVKYNTKYAGKVTG